MSIYRNQAKRVIKHIASQCKITPDKVSEIFGFTVEMIDNRIELTHMQTGLNGKKSADLIIGLWEQSQPDYNIERDRYNTVHHYQDHEFRFRVIENQEIICLFKSEHGDDLISIPHKKEALTAEYLDSVCEQVLIRYNEKQMRINAD
jgi:hypothetical protein